jgi:hypothetical protein
MEGWMPRENQGQRTPDDSLLPMKWGGFRLDPRKGAVMATDELMRQKEAYVRPNTPNFKSKRVGAISENIPHKGMDR